MLACGSQSSIIGQKVGFFLLTILCILGSFKPEWTIPGLKFLAPVQTGLLLMLVFLCFLSGKKKFSHEITRFFIGFLILMIISGALARNNGQARFVIKGMLLLFGGYLGMITFANSQKRIFTIVNIFLLGNLWIAVLGIQGQGLARGVTIFGDQNDLALQMNMILPIVMFLAMKEKRLLKKLFYLTSGLIFLAVIIIGFSRGGFVGLVAVLVFALLKLPTRRLNKILVILIIVGGTIFFAPQSYWEEMRTLREGTKEATAATRIFYWKVATRMVIDHPIIGVGPGNFPVWLPDYVREGDRFGDGREIGDPRKTWGTVCHSLYFTVLAELGLIGVVLFSLMVYWAFKEIRLGLRRLDRVKVSENTDHNQSKEHQPFDERYEKLRSLGLGIMGGLIGFLVSGAFLSVLYYPQFWALCSLSTVLGNLTKDLADEKNGRS
jgi:O-antigen ligase